MSCRLSHAFRQVVLSAAAAVFLTDSPLLADAAVMARREGQVHVAIRDQAAVVRETLAVSLTGTSTLVRIPEVPSGIDASSLTLIDRRGELNLESWRFLSAPGPSAPEIRNSGNAVRIRFDAEDIGRGLGLDAVVSSQSAGTRRFDIVYVLTGISWRASYDVLVRGNPADISEAISVDVDGWVEVENLSGKAFPDARLLLVAADTMGRSHPERPPGILELDPESPLADLWRFSPQPELTPYHYVLDHEVDLPAGEALAMSRVAVRRKPVERILLVRAEEIPTDVRSAGASPSQIIQFKNEKDVGGGSAIPAGKALIYLGSQRTVMHQEGWFKHTPVAGDIRIDLGKVPGIEVRRLERGRVDRVDGGYEQVYELRIANTLGQEAAMLIDEQPPTTMAWTILRAGQPYDQTNRRLIFNPRVAARSETVIQYTVRMSRPSE